MNQVSDDINKKKFRVARNSLFAAIFIVTIKLIASVFSGSLAVLSEFFHSSTDLLACIATLLSVRYSIKPPDREHHYGHEKIESFSALFQVLILVIMCIYIFYEAIERILRPPEIRLNFWIFAVIMICILIDFWRYKVLKKTAREAKSQALEGDALHFSSDILSSVVVLLSMSLYYFSDTSLLSPYKSIITYVDPVTAIIVSLIIIYTTFNLTRKAYDSLMDRVPPGIEKEIRDLVNETKEIEGIKNLRIRSSGAKYYIDMIILVDRTKQFSRVHEITDRAEARIKAKYPAADIVIHSEPTETQNETLSEKVKLICSEYELRCHDIFIHKTGEEHNLDLHIEVPVSCNLEEAHKLINYAEENIKKRIRTIKTINIHIDELSEMTYNSKDITENSGEIIEAIKKIINDSDAVIKCKDFKILENNNNLRISLTCEFDGLLPMEKVHNEVTILENKIYYKFKNTNTNINSIIIHSEPYQIN